MAAKAAKAIQATGRRKCSSARVRLLPVEGDEPVMLVNKRALAEYFPRATTQQIIFQPLEITEQKDKFDIRITVVGGGVSGQAGAVRHGIARALEKSEPTLRPALKKAGLLTRDDRVVERKKPGRHKARKKPQFSKR